MNITLCDTLQNQILCTTKYSQDISSAMALIIAEADASLNPVEEDELMQQAERLLLMNRTVIKPITDYYTTKETRLCR